MKITFEQIKNDKTIQAYIRKADQYLSAIGFTEHSFAHVGMCATKASAILKDLGYSEREQELAKIAGYMHDIGNIVNRVDHAQSGALMAFRLLDKMGMDPEDVADVVAAIGNHDESTAVPVSAITAALILADKSDVRRSRVRNRELVTFDIHDRVNYAVEKTELSLSGDQKSIVLKIKIDTDICVVMNYFEIFLGRMMLCRKAAEYLGLKFELIINDTKLL